MSRERKQKPVRTRKLTGAEKKQITAIRAQANLNKNHLYSAQQTIPYQRIWQDGVCLTQDNHYTKTIQFQDINYRLAQESEQNVILDHWCNILNYFSPSISVQLTFLKVQGNEEAMESAIVIEPQEDSFDEIREEYSRMLQNQMAKGNNGYVQSKYLTFGVHADSLKEARSRLHSIEVDLLSRFKTMDVIAEVLDGRARLALMHTMLHMDDPQEVFQFEWDWLPKSGLSTKDFIAPSSFSFKDARSCSIGGKLVAFSFIQATGKMLDDDFLAKVLGLDTSIGVTLHIQPLEQQEALKRIRRLITDTDQSKIDEQKKAVRSGYDMMILPKQLTTNADDLMRWMELLQDEGEHMLLVTAIVMHTADTRRNLENMMLRLKNLAQEHECHITRLDYQQEDALVSTLPLGLNRIPIQCSLSTTATGGYMPFMTQELFQEGSESLYYGLNALSNNLIMANRKTLKCPNGLILGSSGSGKSFAAKREITNAFLSTQDDIMICDPEGEYFPLVERLNGQVIRFSPNSTDYINPLDIHLGYSDDNADPVALKSEFLLSLFELILDRKDGVVGVERSIIDRSIRNIYLPFLANPHTAKMPILSDLHAEILRQPERQAEEIAAALELYVSGSLNVFNHQTNVDIHNRVVCYDIKDLGTQLKKISMLIVQDQIWSRVSSNRSAGRSTRYYIDELHLLLREKQTATYTVEIWKRFRKWGGVVTGITQNAKDLLASFEIENIIENSDFVYMLNQADKDREILAQKFSISDSQLFHVKNAAAGEGLMFFGNMIVPFRDHFPKDTELYQIMTTKPSEVHAKGGN